MNTKVIVPLILLVVILLAIALGLMVLREKFPVDVGTTVPPGTDEPTDNESEPILIEHSFSNGTHTYKAVIVLPTPCHTVGHNALVAESFPEQITLEFDINEPAPDVFCTQVISNALVTASAMASENAALTGVRINGENTPFEIKEE